MKILAKTRDSEIANVYIAEFDGGKIIEFVESIQPPLPAEKKWVLLVSTLAGCPIGCKFCDCAGNYKGKLSKEEIFDQIFYLINLKYSKDFVPVDKFKIQFARMGEPALNMAVLDVLEEFESRVNAPGFLPSLSTIAPKSADAFFERLLSLKKELYPGRFQMQFSLHTTDEETRKKLIPAKTWSISEIANYGDAFFDANGRKITLNFAYSEENPFEPEALSEYFDPEKFLIKITPLNPTYNSVKNGVKPGELSGKKFESILELLDRFGYRYIISVGELEENAIGSNCGQYVTNYLNQDMRLDHAYNYELIKTG